MGHINLTSAPTGTTDQSNSNIPLNLALFCSRIDTDSGRNHHNDLDSDDDGCLDVEAGNSDSDNDGILGNSPVIVWYGSKWIYWKQC